MWHHVTKHLIISNDKELQHRKTEIATHLWHKSLLTAIASRQEKISMSNTIKLEMCRALSFWPCHCTDTSNSAYLFRCLAHIVNLATQAVISTRSKSRYYNSNPEDNCLPDDITAPMHNEISIIRAICIKVCSTSEVTIDDPRSWWVFRHAHPHSGRAHSKLPRFIMTCHQSICSSTWRFDGAPHMSCCIVLCHIKR